MCRRRPGWGWGGGGESYTGCPPARGSTVAPVPSLGLDLTQLTPGPYDSWHGPMGEALSLPPARQPTHNATRGRRRRLGGQRHLRDAYRTQAVRPASYPISLTLQGCTRGRLPGPNSMSTSVPDSLKHKTRSGGVVPPLGTNNWLPPLRWLCLLPKQDKVRAPGPQGARPQHGSAASRSSAC